MKTITFFTLEQPTFLKDIVSALRSKYNVKFFQMTEEQFANFMRGDQQSIFQAYHNTDIAWFEWCDKLFVEMMRSPKPCKIINRLHSYEMFTQLPRMVDWNKVDKLIFVSPVVRDISIQKFGIRPDITTIINNGIDLSKYKIPTDKKFNKKIAFVGYLNYKKAPELLLHVWNAIHKYDPEYKFYIAGDFQDERLVLYFNAIAPKMPKFEFCGWVKDVPKFLEDKDFIISTSLFESFQYSLAEGMAQGCVPLIHGWMGSDVLYPKSNIFYNIDECVDIIKAFESLKDEEKDAQRKECREFINRNYAFENKLKEITNLIDSL